MNVNLSGFNPQLKNIIRNAIEENFQQEGRYGNGMFGGGSTRWAKSYRAKSEGGKTLQDTGQLAASIRVDVQAIGDFVIEVQNDKPKAVIGSYKVEIGSNKSYAKLHQFGGYTFYKGRQVKVPARPFLTLTDSDVEKIRTKFAEWLLKRLI